MAPNPAADQLTQWQQLKQQAQSGEFRMEDGIGEALFKRCETLLSRLHAMKLPAGNLAKLSGYGGLPSAQALQAKFEQKATGGGGGGADDNVAARLQNHIDTVQAMCDTYRLATAKLRDQDETNARQIVGLSARV